MAAMDWESIKKTFFTESRENLSNMEESILALESGDDDPETINILFRAVHTIKGSSGMFGCSDIERFTHRVENTLQKLRGGSISVTPALLDTLVASHDHVLKLLSACEETENPELGPEVSWNEEDIFNRLDMLSGNPGNPTVSALSGKSAQADDNTPHSWMITIAPGADLFRRGLDPRNFIAYLAEIGESVSVETRPHFPADAADMDVETCYLGFDIEYRGPATLGELKEVFAFMEEECSISITPAEQGDKSAQMIEADSMEPGKDMAAADKTKDARKGAGAAEGKAEAHARNTIRIDTGKIDQLINHVGELVISNAGVVQHSRNGSRDELEDSIENMSRLIENIRESAMTIRMVPVSGAFARFNRVVRDLSRELGKEIELIIEGGDTEIDKSIMDGIIDPLMHIIRNSIDHGIEGRDERAALGKPEKGRIILRAFQEGGALILECEDDGRGLDGERISSKAKALGLLPSEAAATDSDIFNLIFMPGFSTSEKVTSVSGRGVGMDVVRKNVELLRGSVSVRSAKNTGTVFRIQLPLTLAIIDGFIVQVGETRYIIPLYSVTECLDINPEEVHDDEGCSFINLRGEVLSFIRLEEIFGLEPEVNRNLKIVVVEYAQGKMGLAVKRFIGENQTVVKPLGKIFSRHPWISGFTILGSGEIAPILDVSKLIPNSGALHGMRAQGMPYIRPLTDRLDSNHINN